MRQVRLEDFAGAWRFARRIDPADGRMARVEGRALWSRDGTGLVCDETGEMRLQGHAPMPVTRRTLWRDGLRVHFADGRFFHRVPPQGGAVSHWCAPDRYDGAYDFGGWPRFTVTWRVCGPAKNYRMVTRYTREDE